MRLAHPGITRLNELWAVASANHDAQELSPRFAPEFRIEQPASTLLTFALRIIPNDF